MSYCIKEEQRVDEPLEKLKEAIANMQTVLRARLSDKSFWPEAVQYGENGHSDQLIELTRWECYLHEVYPDY